MTACNGRASRTIVFLGLAGALTFATTAARAGDPSEAVNACGCRKEASSGACYCDRKAKCGCPGECEPKGCDEKRAKQLEKEVEIETKKAEAAARKQRPVEPDESARPATPPAEEPAAKAAKHPAHQMTAAEKRTLEHLLDVYLAEHPDAHQKTVDEARAALAGSDHHGH